MLQYRMYHLPNLWIEVSDCKANVLQSVFEKSERMSAVDGSLSEILAFIFNADLSVLEVLLYAWMYGLLRPSITRYAGSSAGTACSLPSLCLQRNGMLHLPVCVISLAILLLSKLIL
jgi:hypothetical protein